MKLYDNKLYANGKWIDTYDKFANARKAARSYADKNNVDVEIDSESSKNSQKSEQVITLIHPAKRFARTRSNPTGRKSAREMAEEFHGRAITDVIDIEEIDKEPSNLAEIGSLCELRIKDEKNEYVIEFAHEAEEEIVFVSCDGEGKQIYFVGGDQDLEKLLDQIETKQNLSQRFLNLGFCSGIVYATDKAHLRDSSGPGVIDEYDHEFGEQGGTYPTLIYDCLNKHMLLAGGTYEVRDVGIWD